MAAGLTEAVTIVTPMEVLKVRLQVQGSKYRNAGNAAYMVVKEEGPRALFSGLSLTAGRQATNVSGESFYYLILRDAACLNDPKYLCHGHFSRRFMSNIFRFGNSPHDRFELIVDSAKPKHQAFSTMS